MTTIDTVYTELLQMKKNMVTKKEIESLHDTIEILSSADTITQLNSSEQDKKKGKYKEIESVEELFE